MSDSKETIFNKNDIIAIILRSDYKGKGIEFFTPNNFSQQLAYMNRPANYKIEPHVHNEVHREVFHTQEVLFIRQGKVKVSFFDKNQVYLESRVLNSGDIILLASGGHGFEMLASTEIIEVKQGPFTGERDKTRFKVKS